MKTIRTKPAFKFVAVFAPLLAVAPILLGLDGGWIVLHLLGGATALVILIYSAYALPTPWRWYAAVGVIISIVTIAVVTDGGSIGPALQIGMLLLLGAIYVASVFWPHDPRPT
ncbi:MAG: hypothetical protein ACRDKE_07680 [Solirubrobacterales bacterium]